MNIKVTYNTAFSTKKYMAVADDNINQRPTTHLFIRNSHHL
jgi:hypothetical protein